MEKLDAFVTCIGNEENDHRKTALINNMYYHIFANDMVDQIGKPNIARQLQMFEKRGVEVNFWKAHLVDIDYVPEQIIKLKSTLDKVQNNVNDMWIQFCLLASYPQLFIHFPNEFSYHDLVSDMRKWRANIFNKTGHDVSILVELIDPFYCIYVNDQTPKNLITMFNHSDHIAKSVIKRGIERFLVHEYVPEQSSYDEDLVDIYRQLSSDMYDSGETFDAFMEQCKHVSPIIAFNSIFSDLENVAKLNNGNEQNIEKVFEKIESCSGHLVTLFYMYMCYEKPVRTFEPLPSIPENDSESLTESYDESSDELEESYNFIFDCKAIVQDLHQVLDALDEIPINTRDRFGETLLMNAVRWRKDDVVLALLTKGADPNMQNRAGKTALHMTCGKLHKNKWSYVPVLLQYGADPFIRNRSGKTAYRCAIQRCAYSTIRAFKN